MMDPSSLIVSTSELEQRLGADDLCIIDARWYLPNDGRSGKTEFEKEHIPGAIFLDITNDLSEPDGSSRNAFPTEEIFKVAMERNGIRVDHEVIIYDDNGSIASRVWYILHAFGHEQVRVLDGGLDRWRREGRNLTDEARVPVLSDYRPQTRTGIFVTKDDVKEFIRDSSVLVLDAREEDRFQGTGIEFSKNKGHIPGSRNVPYTDNFVDGVWKDPAQLDDVYLQVGSSRAEKIVVSCGSGVTACVTLMGLLMAGMPEDRIALYDGSWSEWGNADDVEVETGPGQTGLHFISRYENVSPDDLPWYHEKPDDDLIELFDNVLEPGSRVLDLGAGPGVHSIYLSRRGHRVTCIDLAPGAREMALDLAARSNTELEDYIVADVLSWKPSQTFDAILDRGFMHTLDPASRGAWHKLVLGALRPGGHLLVKCFNKFPRREFGPIGLTLQDMVNVIGTEQEGLLLLSLTRSKWPPPERGPHAAWTILARRL